MNYPNKIQFKSRTPNAEEVLAAAERILDYRIGEAGACMASPSAARGYLKVRLSAYQHEVFACLFLDTRHRRIAFEELFRGTIDGCSVHPREVVKRALELNAAAVILAHNHPSGNPEPSAADRAVTLRLRDALALIDVRVLDHFVVGEGTPTSMAELGWI